MSEPGTSLRETGQEREDTANLILTLMGVGGEGATAWVIIGLVYVVAGLVVLGLWWRGGGGPVRFEW